MRDEDDQGGGSISSRHLLVPGRSPEPPTVTSTLGINNTLLSPSNTAGRCDRRQM